VCGSDNQEEVQIQNSNSSLSCKNKIFLFNTDDPQVYFKEKKHQQLESLIIQIEYFLIENSDIEIIAKLSEDLIDNNLSLKKQNEELEKQIRFNESLILEMKKNEIEAFKKIEALENKITRGEGIEAALAKVYESKGWKFLKRYYKIRDRLLLRNTKLKKSQEF
jgi:hypothetical protein